MATKRPDMESLRKKTLGDPAAREEYEAPDSYYKTPPQSTAVRLEFRKIYATIIENPQVDHDIIADSLFDTFQEIKNSFQEIKNSSQEIKNSSCLASDDIARPEHFYKEAGRIFEKNIQEGLIRRLNQQRVTNEDAPDD